MKIKKTLTFELSEEDWIILNRAQSLISDINEACQNFEDDYSYELYKQAANAYDALDRFYAELESNPTQKIEDFNQY